MKRKKQFIELDVFSKVCERIKELDSYRDEPHTVLALHQFGESLLHPQLERIFEIGQSFDLRLSCATNTKILQSPSGPAIIDLLAKYNIEISVSEHLFKSPQEVKDYATQLKRLGVDATYGTAVWLAEPGATDGNMLGANTPQGFFHHEWLNGQTHIPKKIAEQCFYLRNQIVQVQVDGTIVSCCADAEGESNLGNIMDLNLDLKTINSVVWNGCKTCSLITSYWVDEKTI
jgi:hypothetical protein